MATLRKRMNRKLIESNLSEAIEELIELRDWVSNGKLNQDKLQIGLLHAYHHLNFAWNVRHVSNTQHHSLMKTHFDRWGKYPSEIEDL